MKSKTFFIEVELPKTGFTEISVEVEGSWFNNGIGPYEYWGFKGYDKGTDYFEIENTYWDNKGFSQEEIEIIEEEIKKNIPQWEEDFASEEDDWPDHSYSEERIHYNDFLEG
jgi:hypothetical protein